MAAFRIARCRSWFTDRHSPSVHRISLPRSRSVLPEATGPDRGVRGCFPFITITAQRTKCWRFIEAQRHCNSAAKKGRKFAVKPGDGVVIPAGVGHKRMESSPGFSVIGAYPGGRNWDVLRGLPGERPRADRNIAAGRCRTTIRSLARAAHSSKSGKRNPADENRSKSERGTGRVEGWERGSFIPWQGPSPCRPILLVVMGGQMISRTARIPSLPAKAWRDGTRCLPGMLFSTFQLRLKRIHRAKRKFCGSIHVCNAWLKLQKILPGTFFIRVRVSFVAHMATIA
jgi:hypothetical protein